MSGANLAGMTTDATERTVTVAEAAKLLDVDPRTVRRRAETGRLDARKVSEPGRKPEWRIYLRAIEQTDGQRTDMSPDALPPSVRLSAGQVPADWYRQAVKEHEAALLQLGRLQERTERLQIAEHSVSTLQAENAELRATIAGLKAAQSTRRRRWIFGRE